MEDNSDIAFLAASVEREMRQSLQGSSGMKYNRTDFRNFLNGQVPHPGTVPPPNYYNGQYQHPNYGPPPQQHYPQQQIPGYNIPANDIDIPEGTLNQPIKQIVLPPQYGVPNNGVQGANLPMVDNNLPSMENYSGFNIPNYNQQGKQYLEDEAEFRDALIKEIKSQKKAINKLIRTQEQCILTIQTLMDSFRSMSITPNISATETPVPQEETIDEVSDQS